MKGLIIQTNQVGSGVSNTIYGADISARANNINNDLRGINVNATGVAGGSVPVYGVYTGATGGSAAYGIYSAFGTNYFSGNVGIGTTTPANTLDVRGVGNFSGTIYINNATDISAFSTGLDQWGWTNTTNIVYTTQLTDSVNIGTTAPTHKLNVDGTVNMTGGTGHGGIEIDGNGNIIFRLG